MATVVCRSLSFWFPYHLMRLIQAPLLGLLFLLLLAGCGGEAATAPALTETPAATADTPTVTTERPTQTALPPTPTLVQNPASPTAPPTSAPLATAENEDHPFDSPEYGVQAFLWWRPEIAARDLALIDDMGFGWVKQGFAWRDIETNEKGAYDWWKPDKVVEQVEESGLKLLIRLDRQPFWSQEEPWPPLENAPPADLQDFADFCGAVAGRYQGRIQAYQVWNEPNLSREWGKQPPDPAAYTELLKVCYQAIKAADPDAIVISAGLAPTGTNDATATPDDLFLQGMYDAGAAAYFDVLGLNAPGYKAPPDLDPAIAADPEAGYGGGRWFSFRHVEDMREIMVANGDDAKQVAILEMGWILAQDIHPAYIWHGVTEQQQAEYLVGAYQYAREHWQPWIGLMTTVYVADFDWTPEENEQWWWAITLPDGTPRASYNALKSMDK